MSDDVEAALLIADAATPKTHGSILVENLAVLASEVRRLTAAAKSLTITVDGQVVRLTECRVCSAVIHDVVEHEKWHRMLMDGIRAAR